MLSTNVTEQEGASHDTDTPASFAIQRYGAPMQDTLLARKERRERYDNLGSGWEIISGVTLSAKLSADELAFLAL